MPLRSFLPCASLTLWRSYFACDYLYFVTSNKPYTRMHSKCAHIWCDTGPLCLSVSLPHTHTQAHALAQPRIEHFRCARGLTVSKWNSTKKKRKPNARSEKKKWRRKKATRNENLSWTQCTFSFIAYFNLKFDIEYELNCLFEWNHRDMREE